MTIQDHLDTLCDETPACDLAAYVDLGSGLTLRWSAPTKHPREVMDQMSAHAVAGFNLINACAEKSSDMADQPISKIVHFTARRAEVFACDPAQPDEAVCAATKRFADIETLITRTSQTITTIIEAD